MICYLAGELEGRVVLGKKEKKERKFPGF